MALSADGSENETRPLLPGNSEAVNQAAKTSRKKLVILIVSACFVLAADFGFYLSSAPQTAIFERIICQKHLELNGLNSTQSIPNGVDPCKSEAVQGELALVSGYADALNYLPSILLSLPYGVLMDHWGRKPVMYIGIIGMLLSELWTRLICLWSNVLPLRLIWLAPIFKIIGGGDQVVTSAAFVVVADIFTEEERSSALFRLLSWALVAEVLAAPVSAYLMTFDPWIPYALGFVIIVLGCISSLLLPETLEDAKAKQTRSQPLASDLPTDVRDDNDDDDDDDAKSKMLSVKRVVRHLQEFRESTKFMWRDSNVLLMIFVAFVTNMSRPSASLLIQYTSKKFNWSIAESSLLISIRGIFSIFTFLILMPAITSLAAKYLNLHGKHRDSLQSKITGILSVVGFMLMGLAGRPGVLISGLIIGALGSAFMVSTRSLATALVLPDHVGTLYSAYAISQSIGVFVAGPLLANLFRLGMHLGGTWTGLPFLQTGLLFAIATAAVWRLQVNRSLPGEVEEGGEEEQTPLMSA